MKTPFLQLALLLVILVCLLSGCSHIYPVTFAGEKPRSDTLSAGTVNRRLATKDVIIFTHDGREVSASGVFLTRDSCRFTDTTSAGALLPTSEIRLVRHIDYTSSAVGGFTLGLVGGALLGLGPAALVTDLDDADNQMGVAVLLIGGMAVGSVVGLVVGGSHGTINDYTMPEVSPDSTVGHRQ